MRTRAWVVGGGLVAVAGVVTGGLIYASIDPQPPGSGGVTGTYWATDDTGQPPESKRGGTFLVIPDATVEEVWPEVDRRRALTYPGVPRPLDVDGLAAQHGAVLVVVQPTGRFRINVPAGPAVVCVLEGYGCDEIVLPESGSVEAFIHGPGGFGIRLSS